MIPGEKKLADIIARHNSVCWYPSAGGDLRALLYLSKQFFDKVERLNGFHGTLPDLFILTDYAPGGFYNYGYSYQPEIKSMQKMRDGTLKVGNRLFDDGTTSMTVTSMSKFVIEGIEPDRDAITDELDPVYGRCCYMRLQIRSTSFKESRKLGTYCCDVVYVFAENTSFAKNFLLKNGIGIDWLVKIRYGGGFGGSNGTSGAWIYCLADRLGLKYAVTDVEKNLNIVDNEILEKYFDLAPDGIKLPGLRVFFERNWYYNWRSYWTEVVLPENNNTEELK